MKKKESYRIRLKGQLRLYMQLPVIMAVLSVISTVWIFKIDRRAGMVMSVLAVIYMVIIGYLYTYSKSRIMKDLVEFAAQYGVVQNTLLKELAIPYAILLEDGKAIWMNGSFERSLGK